MENLKLTLTITQGDINLGNGYLFTEEDEPLTKDKFTKIAHSLVEAAARKLQVEKALD